MADKPVIILTMDDALVLLALLKDIEATASISADLDTMLKRRIDWLQAEIASSYDS